MGESVRLEGKVALVTGAAGGIGAAIAAAFRAEGARVYACDLDEEKGRAAAAGIGAAFLKLDVGSEESWKTALSAIMAEAGGIDVLVNNAGINIRKNIEEMPAESLDAMLSVNVKGPFFGIKHAIPLMRARGGGAILNMSSVCGLIGHKFTNEAYTMCKGALSLLTKSVAARYAKDNIRCNSVHPSTVETPLVAELLADPVRRAERLGEVPLGRLASMEDVAAAFVYLASDEASFLNGVSLPVDGGLTSC
jgi:NAD(P)-dependent dehydrogenase (short-subunit alcohol dehydrogenase family)